MYDSKEIKDRGIVLEFKNAEEEEEGL